LFQIWLNLPAEDKFVKPYYKMLWKEDIPKQKLKDGNGKIIEITVVAGSLNGLEAVPPAPDSWAAKAENEVAIWLIRMEANAKWILPAASELASRSLYFHKGASMKVSGEEISSYKAIDLDASQSVSLVNGPEKSHFLLLQGRPIQEPVVQYGPFVMNSQAEIQQAMDDYRKTQFGGWPWSRPDQVHGHERGRFARYSNGEEELREG
jgi:redox-sensitive bicupin YhaK (pirin superfamily)